MPDVELFIPCAPKDYIKLSYVLDSVERCLPEITAAHITTRERIEPLGSFSFPVIYHLDREILDYDYTRFQFRPTWVYQQFLKLFQTVTPTDWYLVMDADRFVNHPLQIFNGEKPVMFLRDIDEANDWYFCYTEKMIGTGKVFDHTFLSECTLYYRPLIEDMLIAADLTYKEWLNKSAEIINATCCIADAELYGTWAYSQQPDLYEYRILRDNMRGKYGDWTAAEIEAYILDMAARDDVDFFTAHSWHD